MFRCTSRCIACQEHILESDSYKNHSTGSHHQIRGHITGTTSNIIYLISCRMCGNQYIGETKNSLNKRFMVTDLQSKPISLTLLWANTLIYLITPFLTWSCRALRCLLTAGNRSVSAEKRCGSGVSTPLPAPPPPPKGPLILFVEVQKGGPGKRVKPNPNSCLQRSSAGSRAVAQGMGTLETQASLQQLSIYSTHYILRCCVCMSL